MLRVRSILFPTDHSLCAERAYTYAAALAERFGAALHVLHVRTPGTQEDVAAVPPYGKNFRPERTDFSRVCAYVAAPTAAEGILRYAQEEGVDIIVMGARGDRRLRKLRLGHTAREVVRHAPCPVLTTRQPLPNHGLSRILAPVDFSEASRDALGFARRICSLAGAELDVLHVLDATHTESAYGLLPAGSLRPEVAREWEGKVRRFFDSAGGPEVPTTPLVAAGPAAPTLINVALQRRADLVLMSTVGRTGLRRALLGSVAESVVGSSPCATLTVTAEALDRLVGRARTAADEAPPAEAPPVEAPPAERTRRPRHPGPRHSA